MCVWGVCFFFLFFKKENGIPFILLKPNPALKYFKIRLKPTHPPEWPAQNPGSTSCHCVQNTGRLLHRSWPCPPSPGSHGWGQWCGHWALAGSSLHFCTRWFHIHQSQWHCRTETPDCPHCLSPYEDSPLLSGALERKTHRHSGANQILFYNPTRIFIFQCHFPKRKISCAYELNIKTNP